MTRRNFTPDPEAAAEKRAALMARLESAVTALQTTDGFKRYLDFASKMHKYSMRNSLLILSQYPEASHVAGFKTWQELGRNVRKGEKGIAIICPRTVKVDDDGEQVTRTYFTIGHVFDISQTDGDPIPDKPKYQPIEGETARDLWPLIEATATALGCTLASGPEPTAAYGYFQPPTRRIWTRPDLSLDGRCAVTLHELAHCIDYDTHAEQAQSFDYRAHRGDRETVAESAAYLAANHYGLDTLDAAFVYVAGWSKEPKTFLARMGEIDAIATALIGKLEGVRP